MSEHVHSLESLEFGTDFTRRHIGPGDPEIKEMLATLGVSSLDELLNQVVPEAIRSSRPLALEKVKTERVALSYLRKMASRNKVFSSMIGMGYSGTVMPKVILRNVLENPGWYTAYTPYQAEVSQGRLEALLNFQQMVTDMTGMEIANASLLDEGTAAAEAMAMAKRTAKSKSNCFFVDSDTHPQTLAVIETRAASLGFEILVGDPLQDLAAAEVFAALFSYPGSSGEIRDYRGAIEALHENQALAIMACDLLSLTLLTPPGELGADIAIGNSQRFGVPMGYGGPHAAFFATRDAYKRTLPGDAAGKPALRMALQTREQHIRREKATSNICTAQVLLAVIAGFYAVYHGPGGILKIAQRVHRLTQILAAGLKHLGFEVVTGCYFDTVTVRVPGQAHRIAAKAREQRINLREVDADNLGMSLDQTTRRSEIERLWACFSTRALERIAITELDKNIEEVIHGQVARSSGYLSHPVFSRYHAETEMLRYLRRLQAKDIALDRSMIPLGSCTMKLNATTEMIPISWREFANMHPFAPLEQTQGYQQLFEELETMLCELTGFSAVSLQPNAGSQGEYSGLLAIHRYHQSRGQGQRNICLIPASAHGTNPASAALAGFKVVVVKCDQNGNIDVDDMRAQAGQHADHLAALMITYPSTHGVFEVAVKEICEIAHSHGGQVYFDGANLNALLGIALPAEIGADVCHMNLHKTFCIPHGGGGPGVGPIGVKAHLAPFLPGHRIVQGINPAAGSDADSGQVCSAPWGSASILPISWAYITMMGNEGLKRATQLAILNANYLAERLKPHYPIVYTGPNGRVAHECIIDFRQIKESCGITVADVAKRLVDYGYHAPTMSWPVVETMMIEPTESEARREIDRFCDSLIQIRKEIADIESGQADKDNNLLHNSPHTHDLLMQDWTLPYSRAEAFFPLPAYSEDKYWPPVARIDNVYGDRNLVSTCPPVENYSAAAD